MALTKINASVIANNTIAVGNIADNSVDATKIASNSILTRHIDDDQITGDQLADNIDIAGTLDVTGVTTLDAALTGKAVTLAPDTAGKLTIRLTTNAANDGRILLRSDTTDKVDIQANGVSYFNGGNVGIGISNPTDPLVVQSSGSIGGGATNANSYFTITDGTYGLYHDPNEIFSDINGTFHIGANHSNGALRFHTGGTSARMDIQSDGRVGIGATPSDYWGTANGLVVRESDNSTGITIATSTSNTGQIYFADGTSGDARYRGWLTYAHGTDTMSLATAASTKVTIASDGKVGIGDTDPFTKLHVENTGWSSGAPYGAVAYIQGGAVNDLNWGHLLISQSGTTTDTGGRLAFGANGENPIAGIRAKYKGATYGDLAFLTRPSGGTNTERMVIDSNGYQTNTNCRFQAKRSGSGNQGSTVHVVVFDSEDFDIGGNYNHSDGNFTAPVTGHYFFYYHHMNHQSANAYATCYLDLNGSTYHYTHTVGGHPAGTTLNVTVPMTAGNTVRIRANYYYYNASYRHALFGGYLLG